MRPSFAATRFLYPCLLPFHNFLTLSSFQVSSRSNIRLKTSFKRTDQAFFFTMPTKQLLFLLIISIHNFAEASNSTTPGTVTAATCTCLVPQNADKTCPKKTAGEALKASKPDILWEDTTGKLRSPTIEGCCQFTAAKEQQKTHCKPDTTFSCPPLVSSAGLKSDNPITCAELPDKTFVCVCGTQADLDNAVGG